MKCLGFKGKGGTGSGSQIGVGVRGGTRGWDEAEHFTCLG